jgi:serine-threonine kinase receptor-associated protein
VYVSFTLDSDESKVWDTYTGETLQTLQHGHIVRAADISSSQTLVASGGHEKKVRLFDLQKGSTSSDVGCHDGTVKSVVWGRHDAADNTVISSGDDKRVIWWDLRSKASAGEFKVDAMITSIELSADRRLLTVTAGKSLFVLDSATYSPRPVDFD